MSASLIKHVMEKFVSTPERAMRLLLTDPCDTTIDLAEYLNSLKGEPNQKISCLINYWKSINNEVNEIDINCDSFQLEIDKILERSENYPSKSKRLKLNENCNADTSEDFKWKLASNWKSTPLGMLPSNIIPQLDMDPIYDDLDILYNKGILYIPSHQKAQQNNNENEETVPSKEPDNKLDGNFPQEVGIY